MNVLGESDKYTKDTDSDVLAAKNCAAEYKGARWYNGCHKVNINGYYYQEGKPVTHAPGVAWSDFRGYDSSLKKTTMKIRPA